VEQSHAQTREHAWRDAACDDGSRPRRCAPFNPCRDETHCRFCDTRYTLDWRNSLASGAAAHLAALHHPARASDSATSSSSPSSSSGGRGGRGSGSASSGDSDGVALGSPGAPSVTPHAGAVPRPPTPVMAIFFEGQVHRIKVYPGPEGKARFQQQIRELVHLGEDEDFEVRTSRVCVSVVRCVVVVVVVLLLLLPRTLPASPAAVKRQLSAVPGESLQTHASTTHSRPLPPTAPPQVEFECRAPGSEAVLHLDGMDAFDAATHCAALTAAERARKRQAQQRERQGRETARLADAQRAAQPPHSRSGAPPLQQQQQQQAPQQAPQQQHAPQLPERSRRRQPSRQVAAGQRPATAPAPAPALAPIAVPVPARVRGGNA
jgi:hypothetical protein